MTAPCRERDDRPPQRRQNDGMALRPTLLAGLLLAACQAQGAMAEGDRHFRLGEYEEAAAAYEQAGAAGAESGALREKLEEARLRAKLAQARDLLHVDRPFEALQLLDEARQMRAEHPLELALRARANQAVAKLCVEQGTKFYDSGDPEHAAQACAAALSWDPGSEEAKRGLALAQDQAARLYRVGEELYFRGLDSLSQGHELRAHTAFGHATTYWGMESRAGERLQELGARLAAESLQKARDALRRDLVGSAWLALRAADRLQPGDPETLRLLAETEAELEARRELRAADMAVRAGDMERAEALAARIGAATGERHGAELARLRARVEAERERQRYLAAYAAELDNQVVRALELYRELMEAGHGGDVAVRHQLLEERLEAAARAYSDALAAEEAGDRERYAQKLAETVRLAADYGDALARWQAMQKTPPGPQGP